MKIAGLVLLLLSVATSASAQDVWILWAQEEGPEAETVRWQVKVAAPSQSACVRVHSLRQTLVHHPNIQVHGAFLLGPRSDPPSPSGRLSSGATGQGRAHRLGDARVPVSDHRHFFIVRAEKSCAVLAVEVTERKSLRMARRPVQAHRDVDGAEADGTFPDGAGHRAAFTAWRRHQHTGWSGTPGRRHG